MRWQHSSLFYLEQWTALFLGVASLAVFLWALLGGHQAFSAGHPSSLLQQTISTLGWLLTIAVALLGTTLIRFAFYTPPGEIADAQDRTSEIRPATTSGNAGSSSSKASSTNLGRS